MRAFVAGATGYTGREVVRELAGRGVQVVAHVRPDSARLAEWRERFAKQGARVDTSLWRADAIDATLRELQPDLVFALLGTTRARARAAQAQGADASYQAVDYGMTAMLLGATTHAKFIYLSSLGVSDSTRNPYLEVRARIERAVKASGLPYVIARPAFVTGSDREDFRWSERALGSAIDGGLALAGAIGFGMLRARFASLTGKELARALVNAALDEGMRAVTLEADALRALARRS